ncbi:MAG: hypothetical protein PUB21_08045 [Bacteroidales bacterium]|nr:hypothetical protein [Bacteroidales bacterium]
MAETVTDIINENIRLVNACVRMLSGMSEREAELFNRNLKNLLGLAQAIKELPAEDIRRAEVCLRGKRYVTVEDLINRILCISRTRFYEYKRLGRIPEAHKVPGITNKVYTVEEAENIKRVINNME